MDCPKCVGKLEEKTIEGVKIDVCFICEGIWFDAGELAKVIEKDSKDFDFISINKDIFDGKEVAKEDLKLNEQQGKCPRCSEMMEQKPHHENKEVLIDICSNGHGIWLDGGEIQLLRHREKVNLHDFIDREKSFLKYAFSKEGLKDLFQRKKIK